MEIERIISQTTRSTGVVQDNAKSSSAAKARQRVENGDPTRIPARDRLEGMLVVDTDVAPRLDRVELVSARYAAGDYDTPEVIRGMAASLLSVGNTEQQGSTKADNETTRTEKVKEAASGVEDGIYRDPSVLRTVAERLAPIVGLTGFDTRG